MSTRSRLGRQRLALAQQVVLLQAVVVIMAAIVGAAAAVWQAHTELDNQYEQRALAVAESVAATDQVRTAVSEGDPGGFVAASAEEVRRRTGATYVVVTDARGIRYSHPNPRLIGLPVDEQPADVLAGHTWVGVQEGTLGVSARGKAPIFEGDRVVGMVSVGYLEADVLTQLMGDLPGYATTVLIVFALGVVGSLLLARRIKRQTFGLEPHEIAGLLEEREASLQGIGEGAVATDREGRITLVNPEARRLLGVPEGAVGARLTQVLPAGRLRDFLAGQLRDEDEVVLAGDRVLMASRRSVRVRGAEIGHVATFREGSELARLAPSLGVDGLTDALRAQLHEFSNRLHVVAGLVELGRSDEALRLITDTAKVHQELSEAMLGRVGDPVLGAILVAKAALAAERGVEFHVGAGTAVKAGAVPAEDLIALVGNLVDNAIDAAARGDGERRVDVSVVQGATGIHVEVRNTGPAIAQDVRERMFTEGFTTKARGDGRRHGIGLALAREVAHRHGGDISFESGAGTIFRAALHTPIAASA